MRMLNKWNYVKGEYVQHFVPDEWKVSIYEDDMDTIVNCASCGKELPFGKSFTSMEIHTDDMGWGYAVCEECYVIEIRTREVWNE